MLATVKGDDDVYVLGVDRGSTNVQKLSLVLWLKIEGEWWGVVRKWAVGLHTVRGVC